MKNPFDSSDNEDYFDTWEAVLELWRRDELIKIERKNLGREEEKRKKKLVNNEFWDRRMQKFEHDRVAGFERGMWIYGYEIDLDSKVRDLRDEVYGALRGDGLARLMAYITRNLCKDTGFGLPFGLSLEEIEIPIAGVSDYKNPDEIPTIKYDLEVWTPSRHACGVCGKFDYVSGRIKGPSTGKYGISLGLLHSMSMHPEPIELEWYHVTDMGNVRGTRADKFHYCGRRDKLIRDYKSVALLLQGALGFENIDLPFIDDEGLMGELLRTHNLVRDFEVQERARTIRVLLDELGTAHDDLTDEELALEPPLSSLGFIGEQYLERDPIEFLGLDANTVTLADEFNLYRHIAPDFVPDRFRPNFPKALHVPETTAPPIGAPRVYEPVSLKLSHPLKPPQIYDYPEDELPY